MPVSAADTKKLILFSILDRIIVDDLLQEKELQAFELKKEWHDLWRRQITTGYGLDGAGGLLDWESLKEQVVLWLKHHQAAGDIEGILQQCRVFEPYGPLPGYRVKEPGRIRASSEARELTLEKICRLLGFEEEWQELFP